MKRINCLVLTMLLVLSLMAIATPVSAEPVSELSVDFETFAGTVAESGWLVPGDFQNTEIVNGALQTTRPNGSGYPAVQFPLTNLRDADIYTVEYTYKFTGDNTFVNAAHTKSFGSNDTNESSIYISHTWPYGTIAERANGGLNANYFEVGNDVNQRNYTLGTYASLMEQGGGWITVKYVIDRDVDNDSATDDARYDLYINGNLNTPLLNARFRSKSGTPPIDNVERPTNVFFSGQNTTADPCTLYIKSIRVTAEDKPRAPLTVIETTPAQNAQDAYIDGDVFLKFNSPVDAATISGISVKRSSNNAAVVAIAALDSTDNTIVKLSFPQTLTSFTEYVVTVPTTVASASPLALPMAAPYILTFTTSDNSLIPSVIEVDFSDPNVTVGNSGWFIPGNYTGTAITGGALQTTRPANGGYQDIYFDINNIRKAEMYTIEYTYKFTGDNTIVNALSTKTSAGAMNNSSGYFAPSNDTDTTSRTTSTLRANHYLEGDGPDLNHRNYDGFGTFPTIMAANDGWITVKYVIDTDHDNNPVTTDARYDMYINGNELTALKNARFRSSGGKPPLDDVSMPARVVLGGMAPKANAADCTISIKSIRVTAEDKPRIPLAVIETFPTQNSTNAFIDNDILLTFNNPVDVSTIGNITLLQQSTSVSATPIIDPNNASAVKLILAENLAPLTQYTVNVPATVASVANNASAMTAPYTFTFTTNNRGAGVTWVEEFDDWDLATLTTGKNTAKVNWVNNTPNASDSVSVANAGGAYGKALKLVNSKSGAEINLRANFNTPVTAPIVKVSYEFMAENHSRYIKAGGSVFGIKNGVQINDPVVPAMSWQNNFLFQHTSNNNITLADLETEKGNWHKYEMVINTMADTYDLYYDGVSKGVNLPLNRGAEADGISSILFNIGNDGWYDGKVGDAVYWIDNFEVSTPAPLTAASVSPESSDDTAIENRVFTFNLNRPITSIAAGNVEVKAGTTVVDPSNYAVARVNDQTVTVTFNSDLVKNTNYSITLKGLKSDEAYPIAMQDYTYTCKTRPDPFECEIFAEIPSLDTEAGNTIDFVAKLVNNRYSASQSYVYIATVVDKNGKMYDIDTATGTLALGGSVNIPTYLDIPDTATNEYKINIFVWESTSTGVPILSKIVLP